MLMNCILYRYGFTSDLSNYFVYLFFHFAGVFGIVYDGFLSNAEDDPEGATPVIIKTIKGGEDEMLK